MRPEETERGLESGALPGGRPPAPAPARVILVIEDHLDTRESLQQILQIGGHTVHVADSGHSGIEAAGRLKPDIAVIDIGLPGINGYEVARTLRQQASLAAEPDAAAIAEPPAGTAAERTDAAHRPSARMTLIALTGFDDAGHAEAAGFDAHLIKPVDLDQLRRLIVGASILPRREADPDAGRA